MKYKKITKTIRPLLKDIYKLRTGIHGIYCEYKNDVDNNMMADKIEKIYNVVIEICDNRINEYEPFF
jgi:hypothetical protein